MHGDAISAPHHRRKAIIAEQTQRRDTRREAANSAKTAETQRPHRGHEDLPAAVRRRRLHQRDDTAHRKPRTDRPAEQLTVHHRIAAGRRGRHAAHHLRLDRHPGLEPGLLPAPLDDHGHQHQQGPAG